LVFGHILTANDILQISVPCHLLWGRESEMGGTPHPLDITLLRAAGQSDPKTRWGKFGN